MTAVFDALLRKTSVFLLALLAGGSGATAQESTSLNVATPYGAFYVPGAWMPVTFTLTNRSNTPFDGTVQVQLRGDDGSERSGTARIDQPVKVAPMSRVTVPTFVYLSEGAAGRTNRAKQQAAPPVAQANLYSSAGQNLNHQSILSKPASQISGEAFQSGAKLLLWIQTAGSGRDTSSYDASEAGRAWQYASGVGVLPQSVDAIDFIARAPALSMAGAVVLDAAPNEIDVAQRQTLIDWVRAGGVLIVSAPTGANDPAGSWLEPLLPVTMVGTRQATEISPGAMAKAWSATGQVPGMRLRDADGEEQDKPKPVVKPAAKGATINPVQPTVAKADAPPVLPRDVTVPILLREPVEISEAIESIDAGSSGVVVLARDDSYIHAAYRPLGLGRIVFTSFPAGALEMTDARAGLLWKALIGPQRRGFAGAAPATTVLGTALEQKTPLALSSLVGASVPPWSVAAGVGGGYLLLVLVCQFTLGGARRPLAFAVIVGSAVVLSASLLVLGKLKQAGQPIVAASLSVADVLPEGGGMRQDALAVYGPSGEDIRLSAAPGASIDSLQAVFGSAGEPPVISTTPFSAVLRKGSVSTESIGRVMRTESALPTSVKARAAGTFGATGLTVTIDNQTGDTLGSPLVVWNQSTFSLPDIQVGSTTVEAGEGNRNPRGTFTNRAVFTSERDRLRGDIVRWTTEPSTADGSIAAQFTSAPIVAAWTTPAVVPPLLVTTPAVDSTRGEALLRLPLTIQPTPAGTTIRTEAAFNQMVVGPTPVSIFNPAKHEWISTNQGGAWTLGFEAPRAIGRVLPTKVTIVADMNAPRQTVLIRLGQVRDGKVMENSEGTVLATWTNPVTPQTISLDVSPDDVDAEGRLWLRLQVDNPASDAIAPAWQMLEFGARFDEALVQ